MDEHIINLNLLENIIDYINESDYLKIYSNIYDISVSIDVIDTFLKTKYQIKDINYYYMISIFNINELIKMNPNKNNNKKRIIYNRYISKSLSNISSKNKYNYSFPYHNSILYILYTWDRMKDKKYLDLLNDIYIKYPKILISYCNYYNLYYTRDIQYKSLIPKNQ